MTTNPLVEYFRSLTPLTPEEEQAFVDSMEVVTLKKGEYLKRDDQLMVNTYFVMGGCIRHFVNIDGEESTTDFYTDGYWIISSYDSLGDDSSFANLKAEEDTELVLGNEEKSAAFMEKHPRFESVAFKVLEQSMIRQRQEWMAFQTGTPEQRYQNLLKTRPDLIQRVPLYQIASYIGVKPESLSRIRKRLL